MRRTILTTAVLIAAGAVLAWLVLGDGTRGAPDPATSAARAAADRATDEAAAGDPRGTTAELPTTRTPVPDRPAASGAPPAAGEPPSAGTVRGRVVDPLGAPLGSCEVVVQSLPEDGWLRPPDGGDGAAADTTPPAMASTRTGSDGRFVVRPPTDRPLVLLLRHPRFPPTVARASLRADLAHTVDLGDLVLRSEVGLVVSLSDAATGAPVGDARLSLAPRLGDLWESDAAAASQRRAAFSDPRGRAVFYGVPPGAYQLRVEAGGFATEELAHVQPQGTTEPPRVEVALAPGEVLRGRVLDARGHTVPDAALFVRAVEDGVATAVHANDNGDFRVPGLRPGGYDLLVESLHHGQVELRGVQIPRPGPERHLELRFAPTASIGGRVVEPGSAPAATPQPVAGATVEAEPLGSGPIVRAGRFFRPTATTGADGRFRIDGLPEGRYQLAVSSNGLHRARRGPVESAIAAPVEVEITVPRSVWLEGVVVAPAGHPLAGAEIDLMPDDYDGSAFSEWRHRAVARRRPPAVRSAEDGRFRVARAPGASHRLRVRAAGRPTLLCGPFGAATADVDVGRIVLPAGATIEGTARGPGEIPAANALVCLDPVALPGAPGPAATGTSVSAQVVADGRGHFSVGPVTAGTYDMFYYFPERQSAAEIADVQARTRVRIELRDGTNTRQNLVLR